MLLLCGSLLHGFQIVWMLFHSPIFCLIMGDCFLLWIPHDINRSIEEFIRTGGITKTLWLISTFSTMWGIQSSFTAPSNDSNLHESINPIVREVKKITTTTGFRLFLGTCPSFFNLHPKSLQSYPWWSQFFMFLPIQWSMCSIGRISPAAGEVLPALPPCRWPSNAASIPRRPG